MAMFAERSLRRQLVFWLILPLSLALICSALVAYKLAVDFVTKAYDRALYDSALDLSRRMQWKNEALHVDLPPAAADMLMVGEPDRVYYSVRSSEGRIVVGKPDLPLPPVTPHRRPTFYYGSYENQAVRLVVLGVPYGHDDEEDLATVLVAETLLRREILQRDIFMAVIAWQLILIAMVSVAVYVGVGHGLLPLGRLRTQIEIRSHRDLTPLDEPDAPNEVRPLIRAINDLMARLQRAITAQHKFIADAAHQLRTPLAGLKTHAELALREGSVEGMRERVRSLMLAADRSTHLANQLLALARAEPESGLAATMHGLDLAALSREVTSEFVPRAIEASIDLGANPEASPVLVRGNAVLVRELLGNLLDNALRYTPTGGHVTVTVANRGGEAELSVEDDGPGIPPEHRAHVFDRFQRLGANDPHGCGLGLAIVREIAELHSATIHIRNGDGDRGTRVGVVFPVHAAESAIAA